MGCALVTRPGSFSATSESLIVSGCSPLRMGADSHERCGILRAYDSTSLCLSYAAVEAHARF